MKKMLWIILGGIILSGILWLSVGNFFASNENHPAATDIKAEDVTRWVQSYGGSVNDKGASVAIAANGDIVVAGATESFGSGGSDGWVIRLDPNGSVVWQKTYGGSKDDGFLAIAIADNGDIIVAGFYDASIVETSDYWVPDGGYVWVLRLSGTDGSVIWQKTYDEGDADFASSVTIASNGDIIVAGTTGNVVLGIPSESSFDAWVLRLDSTGNIVWESLYDGGDGDVATGVAIAPNGDIVLGGYTKSYGAGKYDFWALRLNGTDGSVIWQKAYGGSETDAAYGGVAITPNGNIVLAGTTWTDTFGSYGYADAWVIMLDENGNVTWENRYGTQWGNNIYGITIADNGDIIVAGMSSYDLWVLSLNATQGNITWQKGYGGGDKEYAGGVAIAPNGDIVVAGYTNSFGAGENDTWVLRLPSDGALSSDGVVDSNLHYGDTTANIAATSATITNTTVTPSDPNFSVGTSSVTPQNTDATVNTQYLLTTAVPFFSNLPAVVLIVTLGILWISRKR